MTRWLTPGLFIVALACGVAVVRAQQQPTFRASGDTVRVYATVLDDSGRLVTSLTKDDFEIRDEGKPQPITLFDNSGLPVRMVVMFDVSGSMKGNLPILRTAAQQLFARLRPGDKARVGTFGHQVEISPTFTNDPKELMNALPDSIDEDAPTPLWRALYNAMDAFKEGGEERPVVIVLSDGKDNPSVSIHQPFMSQGQVIDRARRDDVMVYAVGMRSRGGHPVMPVFGGVGVGGGMQAGMLGDLPDPGLAKVAEDSGGGYLEVHLGEDLGRAFSQVADELHSQYLLGYAPPKRDGKTHKIDLRVDRKGMKPRARQTYTAPKS